MKNANFTLIMEKQVWFARVFLPALILATLAALTLCAGALADQHIQVPDTPEAIADKLNELTELANATQSSAYTDDYREIWDQLTPEQQQAVREIQNARLEAREEAEAAKRGRQEGLQDVPSYASEQWVRGISNIFVNAYWELPADVTPSGRAAAGEEIVRGREHYQNEISTHQQARDQIGAELQAANDRKTTATNSLASHLGSYSIWENLDFLSDDRRADYLNSEIEAANNQLGVLGPLWVATNTALETTIKEAADYEQSLVLNEIKNNPELVQQEDQRRTDEVIAAQRELATSRLQFVAGQEQYDRALEEAEKRIEEAQAEDNDILVEVREGNKENIELTYQFWLAGQQSSLYWKGMDVTRLYQRNAEENLGPTDKTSLMSNIMSCGLDPILVLEGRDPITLEFVDKDNRDRVAATANSADRVALGAEWGASVDYDWGDWTFTFLDELYTWDTLTGAPQRFGYYALGVGEAGVDLVYDLGVFVIEGGDFIGESAQWYANEAGLEIDVFGHENRDAFADVWVAGSELDSKGIYNATQGAFDSIGRTIEQRAGRGEEGTREMMQDLGYGTTTAGTFVVAPEVVVVKAAVKGAQGTRLLLTGARAGEQALDAATTGARVLDATSEGAGASRVAGAGADAAPGSVPNLPDGPRPGSVPGQGISDEFAEAATPRGDGTPGAGTGAARAGGGAADGGGSLGAAAPELTVDVLRAGDGVILTRSDPGSTPLRLENPRGVGGGTEVYDVPGWPNHVVKITDATGSDLNRVGAAANDVVDRSAAAAPRVHATYKVSNGDMAGYTVQVVDRAPPHFGSDAANAIKTADGAMTAGQVASMWRGLDAYADVGFGVADLKMDNFTFWRLAGPDEWLWIPIDGNMFLPFKTPDAAKAFHADLFNLPDEFVTGPWRNLDVPLDNWGRVQNGLADAHDAGADWNRLDNLLEEPFYNTLRGNGGRNRMAFPYNPRITVDLPALRTTGEAAADAARGGLRALDDVPADLAAPAARAAGAATPPAAAPDLLPNWVELDAQGIIEPPFLPRGLPPSWLANMGVDHMPGFLGNAPVRAATCDIGPVAASGTAAAQSGLNLHVPWQWIKTQRIFPDQPTATSLLPFVGGRFIAGYCDENGDCPGATGVVSLRFDAADEPRVASLANGSGAYYVGADSLRGKQASANDPYFNSRGSWGQDYDDQWAIKQIGLGPDVRLEPGASRDDGEQVIVAVIDTGLAWNHRDIGHDRLWLNSREIPTNGIDDDNNGYVDDIVGWNFVNENNLPWDLDGHGTLVAGIIGAATDNAIGTAGINPQARIMVLRALDEIGNGRSSDIAEAITYAVNNGARIINLSVGSSGLDPTEQLALDYAYSRDVLVVVAAGSEGVALDNYGPGGADNVLTVAATDVGDQRLASSNWGPQVDLAAPGLNILGPRAMGTDLMANMGLADYQPDANVVGQDGGYYRATGTSLAAPIVAGVASLVWGNKPSLTAADVRQILEQSARDVETPGRDRMTGYGIVDANAALAADPAFFITAEIASVRPVKTNEQVQVQVLGTADANLYARAYVEIGAGDNPDSWTRVGDSVLDRVHSAEVGLIPAEELASANTWTIRLVVEHATGSTREARYVIDIG